MSDEAIVSTAPESVVVEATTPVAEAPAAETPETPEPPKQLTPEELQKKFDRDAAAQRRKYERDLQAEREARIRLEERLAHLKPAATAPKDGEPQLQDYENFDEYVAAKAKFIAEKTIQAQLAEREQRAAEEKERAEKQRAAETFRERMAGIEKEIPDFHEVMEASANMPLTATVMQVLLESEYGPKLAYYLATHPEEAGKISTMTPTRAVRALTLIEEGFKKPLVVSKAAPPISPTGSRSTAVKSLTDITTQAEFEKRRREFIAKRR